jgi:hypothetical protein
MPTVCDDTNTDHPATTWFEIAHRWAAAEQANPDTTGAEFNSAF